MWVDDKLSFRQTVFIVSMDSYQNKNVDPCVSLFAPNKVKTDIPNRCRVNKCFCFFGGRALFWCLGPLSFRQQHLNDIEYSNLTILVLQQNDSTIKFVGTCLSFSNKCLFEFPTMFGFPMPPWVSTSSQTHQFCRLKSTVLTLPSKWRLESQFCALLELNSLV